MTTPMMQRAQETFWAPKDRLIRAGDMVAMDDPVVAGREHLFSPVAAPAASDPQLLGRISMLENALGQALGKLDEIAAAQAPAPDAKIEVQAAPTKATTGKKATT